jgi:choline kinase
MKKIKRLSESDLNRIVKKVINEQSDEMDPNDLYRMYVKEIESEMKNIDDSLNTLGRLWEDIDMDENLDQDDKDDLFSEISDYLKTL